ncbi:UDP-2,3-diacylglucosamine diphosphatase [Flammeovirga kamogawensis]|uniref:UDP-2,3-diacylglucosamine diphosphatase n=1 Tax=Flammeovirga kamogawensis TaxID=373891 RepID=A0ABX8H0T5_9BACT|nr:UDP-2,3-diacylglucosamine diphosphatase [Flammeovirga kamogawensis]MBB6459215.1 UDP-2,3-diacylglucosamine hydrolase [Flammeovirga kamogawensis]QWG08780.1 UDP-2,3-diacylglucosamine diphosphatase [Flammeovirga kamogawensis]TRX67070.1 UDP-2,3-diacylglucosamine diphosphatase [Flammeovirga kamogawensis]
MSKKIYFASDFHLGTPSYEESLKREKKICRWLDMAAEDAEHIYLLGDIFDFWFEYRFAIPKGFLRFQGKLSELVDKGIKITLFTGNHDMWMFDYFEKELGVPIIREPIDIELNGKKFHIGHGDGLGPGDNTYKFLKKVFANKACQWLFGFLHPTIGMGIAQNWSKHSRAAGAEKEHEFHGKENEWLWQYCQEKQAEEYRDYYIFGHRHLPLELDLDNGGKYINTGEWLSYDTYATFDGEKLELLTFK